MANNLFPKSNFTKFVNRYVKILGGRFYDSPSLKDVAWLERAQLIFLIFHTFAVCKVAFLSTNLKPAFAIENYISRSIYGEANLRLQSKPFNPPPNVDRSDW